MSNLGFNIQDFKTSIATKGILRSHSFMMVISLPKFISPGSYNVEDLTLRCESSNIPGMSMMSADGIRRYGYGAPEKIPYGAIFNDITTTFVVDHSASQYKFFNIWMNGIYNTNTQNGILTKSPIDGSMPFEVAYKEDYATTINIFMYNEATNKVLELTLHEAFPIQMHDTNMSWGDTDNIVRLSVSFSYRNLFIKTFDMPLDSTSHNGLLQNIVGGLIGDISSQASMGINSAINNITRKLF